MLWDAAAQRQGSCPLTTRCLFYPSWFSDMAAGPGEEKDLECPEATDELPGQAGSTQRKDRSKGTLSSLQASDQEVPSGGLSLAEVALCGTINSWGNVGHRAAPAWC